MTLPRWLAPGAVAFLLVWVLLLAAGRSAFFKDPGTFWHTTTGELILTDGFFKADPYTFTHAGKWWVPHQWLGEVAMALAHRVGGFDTLLLGAATLLAGLFAWLAARLIRTGLHPAAVGGAVALGLAAAGSHFHVRPHLFTIAATAVVAVLLVETDVARPRLRRLLWLVPLCMFWTNVHGGVLGGIGTVWIAFGGWVVFRALGRPTPVTSWRDVGRLSLVAVGCGLSTLVNPYGLDMLRAWRVIMDAPELRDIILEHRPLDFTAPYAWPILVTLFVYLFVLSGVKLRAVRVTWLLPLVWFALTVSRCRHAPLFAVVALVSMTAMWKHTRWALWLAARRPDLYQPGSSAPRPRWASLWLPAVLVASALALQAARIPVPLIGSGWAAHDPAHWPVELLDVLKEYEPRPGDPHNRLFNGAYIDGGFVIYHAPGYKVFVDDRCELYEGPWLKRFAGAEYGTDTAALVAECEAAYHPDFALTRTAGPIDDVIKASPAWVPVKVTPVGTFYRRK
jgi:hypothetical protein